MARRHRSGGGPGWLSRKYGLAANSVLAIELVTADGQRCQVDAEDEPDLLWALRGGGGSFGVVTALEFRLFPIREVYAGALFWPIDAAAEVLHAWRQWAFTVPEEITSVGRLLRFPPLPGLPEHLRGRSFAVVEAACLSYTERAAAELLAPLRVLRPAADTFRPMPVAELGALHMDPEEPMPGFGDEGVGALPAAGIDAFVAAAGPGSDSLLLSAELRQLGGMLAPGPTDTGPSRPWTPRSPRCTPRWHHGAPAGHTRTSPNVPRPGPHCSVQPPTSDYARSRRLTTRAI